MVEHAQKIYMEILSSLRARLRDEGRLVPDEVVAIMFVGDDELVAR